MKKFLSALCILAMGLSFAACNKEESKPDNGGDTTAPVLGDITGVVLDNAGEDLTTTYTAADFGTTAIINYALFVAPDGKELAAASRQEVKATIADGTITISQTNLNNAILNLGYAAGEEVNVEFGLVAYLGSTIGSAALTSNLVKATFTTTEGTVIDYETYEYLYVIGDFNGWTFETTVADGVQQYIYDYNDDDVFSGTLYFAGKAHNGWKISGVTGSWDDSANWGFNDSGDEQYLVATDPIGPLTLQCSGGSKDIKAWSRNFGVFTFNKTTLELSLKTTQSWDNNDYGEQFDYVMLTGSFCNWAENEEGGAVKLNYDPVNHVFYTDVTLEAGAEIKFFAPNSNYDNVWRLAWGAGGIRNGSDDQPNIVVTEAGNYRVTLDANKDEWNLSADNYGKAVEHAVLAADIPEPYVAVPEPATWSLAGTFTNWDATDKTYTMTEVTHHEFVYYGIELEAGAQLKVVGDYAWTESYGDNTTESGNVEIGDAGTYDIYFYYDDHAVYAKLCNVGWSVIGAIEGYSWTKDFEMTANEDATMWTSDPIVISGEFKLRYRHSWDTNRGAAEINGPVEIAIDTPVAAQADGSNLKVAAEGTYTVTYNVAAETITVSSSYPDNLYLIGNDGFGSWDWSSSEIGEFAPVYGAAGQFWIVRYFTTSSQFKFCTVKDWKGDFYSLGDGDTGYTVSGGNCTVDKDGLYIVFVDYVNSKIIVEPAAVYGIGDCFDLGWNEGTPFTVAEDGTASITTAKENQLRMYVAAPTGYSIDWWKMEFIFFDDGAIVYRGNGGDPERYTVAAGATVTLNFNTGTGSVK